MREITNKNYVQNREQFILDKCKGKKVLHLGCCDSPVTEYKFKNKTLLFQRIEEICEIQQGLDFDQNSINYLNNKGHKNISFLGGVRGLLPILLTLAIPSTLPYWWTIQSIVCGVVVLSLVVQLPMLRIATKGDAK